MIGVSMKITRNAFVYVKFVRVAMCCAQAQHPALQCTRPMLHTVVHPVGVEVDGGAVSVTPVMPGIVCWSALTNCGDAITVSIFTAVCGALAAVVDATNVTFVESERIRRLTVA